MKRYAISLVHLVLATILLVACHCKVIAEEPSLGRPDPNGIIEWTRKVYGNGKWNALPDIAYWRGSYYVAVNQGTFHPGLHGPGIVLRSSNLKDWEHIYTTTGPPANGSAVEGKLLALPDRLILYYLYMHRPGEMEPSLPLPKPDVRNYVETRVVYTEDGQNWSKSQRVYEPLYNCWKPKVHNGMIYMAADTFNVGRTDYVTAAEEADPRLYRVYLLRSADGLKWNKVSTILKGNAHFPITETALVFRPDGEMWAFTRQDFLSHSNPPYQEWTNRSAGIWGGGIGGPEMIAIGNDVYVAGRYYGYLKDHGPASSPQTDKIATSIWKYGHAADKFERIADLPKPAYADLGYTGFVATKDGVFVVYYSGHAYGETTEARTTKADIYLSKLKIDKPASEKN